MIISELLGLLLGLPVGFILGLLGGGGSILAVPIFVYILGLAPSIAIPASLAVVGLTSYVGSIPHGRKGNLDLAAAAFFLVGSIAGSFLGSSLGAMVDDVVQMVVFAIVMLAAATMMLRGKKESSESGQADSPGSGKKLGMILLGLAVGALVGFVGVGGGFMYVPVLVFFAGMTMQRAVGTSLLIIAINATVGFVGYLRDDEIRNELFTAQLGGIDLWFGLAFFALLTFLGVFLGAATASRTDPGKLKKWFAVLLIVLGAYTLGREIFGL